MTETVTIMPIDGAYDTPFRALRLRALREENEWFGWDYRDEAAMNRQAWNAKYAVPAGRVIFGAFVNEKLAGFMTVTPWEGDASGETALWHMVYVAPEFRHKGVARLLYAAREEHTRRHFRQAVFFIRDGNERSTEIHIRNGAAYWKSETMSWNGKHPGLWHWYRKRLDQPAARPGRDAVAAVEQAAAVVAQQALPACPDVRELAAKMHEGWRARAQAVDLV